MYVLVLMKKMVVFMKMPLNDWNMFLKYVFRSELLETLGDGLIYSFQKNFRSWKIPSF